ncbi:MAG TPA: DUF1345 domain-containing protein [Sphingomicrobium sp.]
MTPRWGIGKRIAPPRFIAFVAAGIVAYFLGAPLLGGRALGFMAAFDIAAIIFLLSCIPLLGTREAAAIRDHANANDANREVLLGITGVVMAVLLVAIGAEAMGNNPEPFTKGLIILTLALAWLFSNTVYALHYAHLAYGDACHQCSGLDFPGTPQPVYWDFVYFAFTCGMAFATSDVQITSQHIRKVVTVHCLAAFAFNIGVLAFTINVLGSA